MSEFGSDFKQRLKNILCQAVEENFVAGASLLFIQGGKEIIYYNVGYADIENRIPMCRNTIFRLYSMSKIITGAAVMILMERGELDLLDPVAKYIPGFKKQYVAVGNKKVPVKRDVNLWDLLSMTSGMPYGDYPDKAGQEVAKVFDEIDRRLYSEEPMSTQEIANRLGQCSLSFQPGDAWCYGASADILGAVVEVVAKLKYGEFLKREIFEPLKMKDTGFYVPVDKQHRLAKIYKEEDGCLREAKTNHLGVAYQMLYPPAYESGGAGLFSTLNDYSKFATMLLNRGSLGAVKILSPKTVQFFTSGELKPWQQESMWRQSLHHSGYTYGNMMRVMKNPGMACMNSTINEYGWAGWTGTYFANIPSDELTILLALQKEAAGTTPLARKILNVISSELLL